MKSRWPLVLLLAACSTPIHSGPEKSGPTENVKATIAPGETLDLTRQTLVHSVEFGYPRQQVWEALLVAHENAGMALIQSDQPSGTVVYQFQDRNRNIAGKLASNYVDCGIGAAGPRANTYRLTLRLTHQLEGGNDAMVRVSSSLHASARHPGTSSGTIECSSTGELEKRIVGFIAARLSH